jgi:uncharacterized damage-inducible protein DinB
MTYYGAAELTESFRTVRKNTILAAEEIPEDKYGYQPVAGTRTIGQQLVHIAIAYRFQYQLHAIEKRTTMAGFDFQGLMKQFGEDEAKPRTKAEVLALLAGESEIWAGFVGGMTEAQLAEKVEMMPGSNQPPKSRFEMILSVKEHEMHHRGQIMLMQRMLGIVPHLTREFQARFARMQTAAKSS